MRVFFFCFLFLFFIFTSVGISSEKKILDEVSRLETYIANEQYDQAFNLIDQIKWKLYDLQVGQRGPEVRENTYVNHYYQFQISNPIEEWSLKMQRTSDETRRKKTRITQSLLKIENPASPYELKEHLIVAAYDIGKSFEGSLVSELELREKQFVKQFAEQQLKKQKGADLIDKGLRDVAGKPGYFVVTRLDTGMKKKAMSLNYYVSEPTRRYILVISFIMYEENYSVYTHLFDAILETIRFDSQYEKNLEIKTKSFMDIYLERQGRK